MKAYKITYVYGSMAEGSVRNSIRKMKLIGWLIYLNIFEKRFRQLVRSFGGIIGKHIKIKQIRKEVLVLDK